MNERKMRECVWVRVRGKWFSGRDKGTAKSKLEYETIEFDDSEKVKEKKWRLPKTTTSMTADQTETTNAKPNQTENQ